ncbi:hypothetical protein [Acetobacter oeni]|uniref:Glycine-rich protein n=1 Tax=Acetobacter oeni TaxID=304077 RepID=A0A511XHS5_9PROT|nr:hypothetical protein [Acetobacter oeni]MBB3882557.1 hypothetical protein [Acetobacter oeni]NHO18632.1 hypothetical protein [Acetobacter oeni]GBR11946.1 hypothetical protein AA21952_3504 [Acetobacter oeni LMG 21952]GEN62506.1 hypothetical protein AOE01nite_07300 [Acetobacter oeni]
MRRKTSACLLAASLIVLSACEKPDPDTCEKKHGQSMMGRVGHGLGTLGGMAGGMGGGGVGQGVGMGMRGLSTLAGLADGEGGGMGGGGMGGGGPGGSMGSGMNGGQPDNDRNRMDDVSPCGRTQKHTSRVLPDHAPDEEVDPSQIRFSEGQ